MNTTTNGQERIVLLKARERELRAKIAAEQVRQQKRREKENARLFSIVGQALVESGAKSPETLGLMLKQVLASAVTDEPTRKFLSGRGWL